MDKYRYEMIDGTYHVFSRGASRRHIFLNDHLKWVFIQLLEKVSEKYGFKIHAFCIMGNHYHLLLSTPKKNLSDGMRYLNSRYALSFNQYRNKSGPVFDGRFKSIYVASEKYFGTLIRYIHRNPLEAGLVRSLLDYEWSSYKDYISKKQQYFDWLDIDDFKPKNIKMFSAYSNRNNNQKIIDMFSKKNTPLILK
jgi:putative transposase